MADTGYTSVFDPVLCELLYRWFSPPGGLVFDPFAGGSVRGMVASALGRRYIGIDLSERQCAANRKQAESLSGPVPAWYCGDSAEMDRVLADAGIADAMADFVFSCPPYANLERYSDNPKDLSTMPYPEFLKAYRAIIAKTVAFAREDSFLCFVVSEVRDKRGFYYGLVPDTIRAFRDAGAGYYNEAILVTPIASLSLRARSAFAHSRKLGRTHQNALIFCKGSPQRATERIGPCQFADAVSGMEAAMELLE